MQAVGICLLSFELALPGCVDQIPGAVRERASPDKQACGQWAGATHITRAKYEEERHMDAISLGEEIQRDHSQYL